MAPFPDVVALHRTEEASQLTLAEHVGQRFALLRCPQHAGRVAFEPLVLDEEAEEALERGDGAGLARDGRSARRLVSQERAEVRWLHLGERGNLARPQE